MAESTLLNWKQATDLTGKVVVVTGCASGIGRATAEQFGTAGAIVYGGDINQKDGEATLASIRAAGGKGEFVALDLTSEQSIDLFVDTVRDKSGGAIDVIASVAGVDRIEPFLKNSPETWKWIIAINFLGPVRMLHRFLPTLIERGKGAKIVTVSSDAGRVGSTGEAFYSGSKGAVISLTKALAREMARYKINCNCVAPGPTDTPLFTQMMAEPLREALVKAIPFRRMAQPWEIAHSILFLSSGAADFITGQVFSVSGGLTMHG